MFKSGHIVFVTTWENDADNYITKNISGLTLEQANAIVEFAKFFTSGSNNRGYCKKTNRNVFGNAEYDTMRFGYVVSNWRTYFNIKNFENLLLIGFNDLYQTLIIIDTIHNIFRKIIGSWGDGQYVRVAEKVEVFYVPQDVQAISSFNFRNL